MKNQYIIIFAILLMAVSSCTVDNASSTDPLPNAQHEQSLSKTIKTSEMEEFKDALVQLSRTNALERQNGENKSMFDQKNTDAMAIDAKSFLLAAGYSEADLQELDNRMLFLMALKEYAHLSQSKSTN